MKYIIMVILGLCLLSNTSTACSQTADGDSEFIADFGDVPLMKGLVELDGERVIFDTESGTIAETILVGTLKVTDILEFYSQSLKQLGWEKIEAGHSSKRLTFVRDRQVLSLRLFDLNGTINLFVHLEPGG